MKVLVTGGAGYIGSHICLCLLKAGHQAVALDNFCNSTPAALERVSALLAQPVPIETGDIRDRALLDQLFTRYGFDAVIHCAGLKSVGESVRHPARYHDNNVNGSRHLLDAMIAAGVRQLIFSSSASVYDPTATPPCAEDAPLGPINPYGVSKLLVEQLIDQFVAADTNRQAILLRYYNPVGAYETGDIGECPRGIPNNLMPLVCNVAIGDQEKLSVFGGDYPTPDGTAIRDYIHVMDLAESHVAALDALSRTKGHPVRINIGTGQGCSVLELVHAFEKTTGIAIPLEIICRREGDVAISFADTRFAETFLGWKAYRDIHAMCQDAWRWRQQHPGKSCEISSEI